jgi:hypothetical protein
VGSEKLEALRGKLHKDGEVDVARDSSEVLLCLPFYSTKQRALDTSENSGKSSAISWSTA